MRRETASTSADRQVGDLVVEHVRRVRDGDAALARRGDVDAVVADAEHRDDLERGHAARSARAAPSTRRSRRSRGCAARPRRRRPGRSGGCGRGPGRRACSDFHHRRPELGHDQHLGRAWRRQQRGFAVMGRRRSESAHCRRSPILSAVQRRESGLIDDLKGKSVLVTGASTGIGAAAARAFGARGARVAVHYNASRDAGRSGRRRRRVRRAAKRAGRTATSPGRARRRRSSTQSLAAFGRLDVLVNNAGGLVKRTPIAEYTDEFLDAVIALNVRQVVCVRARGRRRDAAAGPRRQHHQRQLDRGAPRRRPRLGDLRRRPRASSRRRRAAGPRSWSATASASTRSRPAS